MSKKFQVFISSTWEDLQEARQRLIMACLELGHIPVGMELFNAANDGQWEYIRKRIDECDYYAVIIAHRYGSTIEAEDGISYTEKEYRYALEKNIPVMAFILSDNAEWKQSAVEKDDRSRNRLAEFKKLCKTRLISHWSTTEELASRFIVSFTTIQQAHPRIGWVPASEAATPQMANEIARLSKENAELRQRASFIDPDAMMNQRASIIRVKMRKNVVVTKDSSDQDIMSKVGKYLSLLDVLASVYGRTIAGDPKPPLELIRLSIRNGYGVEIDSTHAALILAELLPYKVFDQIHTHKRNGSPHMYLTLNALGIAVLKPSS